MKPVRIRKDRIKIKQLSLRTGNGRSGTVVHDVGRTHRGSRLQIIDAETVTAAGNKCCSYIVFAKSCDRAVTDGIVRNGGHKFRVVSIVGQRYCYIGLAAAVIDIKFICLYKFFIARGR